MRAKVIEAVRDGLLVLGAAALAVGVGMIYRPAGVIAAGALMLAAGILGRKP